MPAFLVPLEAKLKAVPLEKAVLVIGRQNDCDIILNNSRKVSRKHCIIAQVDDTWVIRDLGSTNGVTVNGTRIDREQALRSGDNVTVGDVPFRLMPTPALGNSPTVPAPRPEGKVAPAADYDLSLEMPVAIPEEADTPFRPQKQISDRSDLDDDGPIRFPGLR